MHSRTGTCAAAPLRRASYALALILLLSGMAPQTVHADDSTAPQTPATGITLFVENVGQFDEGARFQMWGGAGAVWLDEGGLWLALEEPLPEDAQAPAGHDSIDPAADRATLSPRQGVNLRLSYEGANSRPALEPFDRLETTVSYLRGSDPAGWQTDVPVWGGVRYRELYPGIDLEITGEGGRLTQRLVARAGADLSAVRLRIEGADALAVSEGQLQLATAVGVYTLPLLQVEDAAGAMLSLPHDGPQVMDGAIAAPFANAAISDAAAPPTGGLVYSTVLGADGSERGYGIAANDAGWAYVTGATASMLYPTTPGAYNTSRSGSADIIVSVLDPTGMGLIYSTFLGGNSEDVGHAIAVDALGRAVVVGETYSPDYPTTSDAYGTMLGGESDAFVSVLNATGTALVYSTLLGGSGNEIGLALALDEAERAYVTGYTSSADYPTTPAAFDPSYNDDGDAFLSVLDIAAGTLAYSTYLGGSSSDCGYGVAVDGAGRAYVAGYTSSADYPTTPAAYDPIYNDGGDAFVSVLDATGAALAYSTYLGGSDSDCGYGVAVDEAGRALVAGETYSADFPTTPGAYDVGFNGDGDAFVSALDATGTALAYSTFLGGSSWETVRAIALDEAGRAYVTGVGYSTDYPTTPGAYDPSYNGSNDILISVLNPAGTALAYSSYLGSSTWENSYGLALDASGRLYIVGDAPSATEVRIGFADAHLMDHPNVYVSALDVALGTDDPLSSLAPLYLTTTNGRWPPVVGDLLVAHPTVRNVSGGPLHVERLGVRGLWNGQPWEMSFLPVDLEAGQVWAPELRSRQPLEAGDYAFRISYSLDGVAWVETGNEVCFTVGEPAPVYTVTGRVVDDVGTGVADVAVWVDDAIAATTDAQGDYTLSLAAGEHLLTPARAAHRFAPPTREIVVSGDLAGQDFVATASPGYKPWLLMYYLAGDNALDVGDGTLPGALQRMMAALRDEQSAAGAYHIAILYDGREAGDTGYYWFGDDERYLPQGELDMAAPATLVDFVAWAREMAPHDHELLTLWGHGSLTHVLQDCAGAACSAAPQQLPLPDLAAALETISAQGGPVAVLFMETSFSGSIEAAYQVQGNADYYVASESAIWLPTPPRYLEEVGAYTTPESLARSIATHYASYWSDAAPVAGSVPRPHAISVARLSRLPDLLDAVNTLAGLLHSRMDLWGDALLRAQVLAAVQFYDSDGSHALGAQDEIVDLYDFARLLYARSDDAELRAAALAVMQAICDAPDPAQRYIVQGAGYGARYPYSRVYMDLSGSHGVSIFFARPESRRSFYTGAALAFAAGTDWGLGPDSSADSREDGSQWGSMLVAYVNERYPDAPDDATPPPLQVALHEMSQGLYYLPLLR